MRRLIRGDFQPVLEGAFLAEVKARRARDALARVTVLVPSNLLKMHLRRLLARDGGACLNVRFLTLIDLARELAEPALRRAPRALLPALGRELVAGEAARSCGEKSYFHAVSRCAGFPAVLAAAIRDVRDCLISPDDLRRASPARKIRDLADLLEGYERRLAAAGLIDDADLFRLALAEAEDHPLLAGAPPLVYGFYDFTSVQRRLLEAVLRRAGGIVFAPIGEGRAFAYARPALDFFQRMGFADEGGVPAARGNGRALDVLRERLFERPGGGPPAPPDGSVRILACPGSPLEAREIVRQVVLLAREGFPLHEIGVVFRGAGPLPLVDEALRSFAALACLAPEERPAVFLHGGRSLAELRAARSLLLLLDLLAGGLARRDLFEWLHFAGFEPRALALERLARKARVAGGEGAAEWRERLAFLERGLIAERERAARADAAGEGDATSEEAWRQRLEDLARLRALVERLESGAERLRRAASFSEQVEAACGLFAALSPGGAEDLAALCEALEQVAELDRLGFAPDLESFQRLAAEALAGECRREGSFQQGLFLGSLLPARGLPFRALLLPGLEDGVFPRRGRQDPILLDHERAALSARLLPEDDVGLPLARRARQEDRMLFRLACAAAGERLIFFYPRVNEGDGRERLPSPALVAAGEALRGERLPAGALPRLPEARVVPAFDPADAAPPLDLLEFDRRETARAVAEKAPERLLFLAELHPPARAVLRAELLRWRAPDFTPFDAVVPEEPGLAPPGAGRPISPSRLETYARCPFQYYARYVLGLAEPEEDDELAELSPLDRGSLVHRVLEEFGRGIAAAESFPLAEGRRAALRRRLEELLDLQARRFEESGALPHPLLRRAARSRLAADLRSFLEHEIEGSTERRPAFLEVSCGRGAAQPALEIDLGDGKIAVSGAIDRVDLSLDRKSATVIDYKTGAAIARGDGGLDGGRRIQLPLYALACQEVIAPGAAVTRAEYFFCTRSGGGKRLAGDSALWSGGAAGQLKEVLRALRDGIARGVFLADPRDVKTCGVCPFALVCGRGAGLEERFARKKKDGAAEVYFALRPEAEDEE
ncbi:MAG: exodeoxyribonuclease V subunit gamma [Planctomycetes bacterium]|nr:exodeoxyribonuclease V subunit gamma [Planctomycetota bacterium]